MSNANLRNKKMLQWCNDPVEEDDKDNFKQAIVNNIIRLKLKRNLPGPGIETIKSCVYDMFFLDERW